MIKKSTSKQVKNQISECTQQHCIVSKSHKENKFTYFEWAKRVLCGNNAMNIL